LKSSDTQQERTFLREHQAARFQFRIREVGRGQLSALFIFRMMTHCWAIDKMLFQAQ
jgi:hypothetical protein